MIALTKVELTWTINAINCKIATLSDEINEAGKGSALTVLAQLQMDNLVITRDKLQSALDSKAKMLKIR